MWKKTSSQNQDLIVSLTINCKAGLHARPAARIATMTDEAQGPVWIEAKGCLADARGVMDILALACLNGTEIRVRIEDPADKPVLDKIAAFIESGFEGVR